MLDLGKQLKFQAHIAVYHSTEVAQTELRVPWKERTEKAFKSKLSKHQRLLEDCWKQGWQAHCNPVEVGCSPSKDA